MAYVLIRETKKPRRAPFVVCIAAAAGLGLSGALLGGAASGEALAVGLARFVPFLAPILLPGSADHVIRINADTRGHYVVNGTADGVPLQFMIDSGATNIVLTKADARRLNVGGLRFDVTTSTANGPVQNAEIRIGTLTVGSHTATGVPALVNGGELEESLLGMSWLKQFRSIEIKNGVMTLYW
ncbi:MAG TPA: TIGR02281 family clan AA aspartic protease [Rhizomicrobium sp.]|nr:TIGR02281 family clan AA aspartic protease [Rhizomicrobium sp.]